MNSCRAHSKSPFGSAQSTTAACWLVEERLVPEAFVRPHIHSNDVWVYVLTGEVGVLVGEEIAIAGAGEWALKPRDVLHAMWNAGTEAAGSSRPRAVQLLMAGGYNSVRYVCRRAGQSLHPRHRSRNTLLPRADDVDKAYSELVAAGAPAVQPPHNTGNNNRNALLRDPDGNLVEIVAKVS